MRKERGFNLVWHMPGSAYRNSPCMVLSWSSRTWTKCEIKSSELTKLKNTSGYPEGYFVIPLSNKQALPPTWVLWLDDPRPCVTSSARRSKLTLVHTFLYSKPYIKGKRETETIEMYFSDRLCQNISSLIPILSSPTCWMLHCVIGEGSGNLSIALQELVVW